MLRSTKIVHIFNIIKTVLWRPGQILAPVLENPAGTRGTPSVVSYISKWNAQITGWNNPGLKSGWLRGKSNL